MTTELQNRAWKILPKEFREEVKREHNLRDKFGYKNVVWVYERIFGRHNLTSDTEGEEMLTVSRKRVQEFYSKCKEVTMNPYSYPDYSHESALSRIALLDILFGSKCLPDNVDSLSQNPVENCDNESHISTDCDKPAEPKYHIGQLVRCLNDRETYIVLAKVGKYHYSLQGVEHDVHEDYLEPYTEPEEDKAEEIADKAIEPVEKYFDHIINRSFSKERRLHIAAMAMQGLLSNAHWLASKKDYAQRQCGDNIDEAAWFLLKEVAEDAVEFADALISEVNGVEEDESL